FIEGGHEHHGALAANQFEHFKAIELGHLNIEEEQIGVELGHHLYCLKSIGALRHNLKVVMTGQELTQHLPGEFLVVDNHRANLFAGHAVHDVVPFRSAGRRSCTTKLAS